jgi:hypothetical protein
MATSATPQNMAVVVRVPPGSRFDGIAVSGMDPRTVNPIQVGPEQMYSMIFARSSFPEYVHFVLRGSGPMTLYRFDQ